LIGQKMASEVRKKRAGAGVAHGAYWPLSALKKEAKKRVSPWLMGMTMATFWPSVKRLPDRRQKAPE
jgi:hypothetical protein